MKNLFQVVVRYTFVLCLISVLMLSVQPSGVSANSPQAEKKSATSAPIDEQQLLADLFIIEFFYAQRRCAAVETACTLDDEVLRATAKEKLAQMTEDHRFLMQRARDTISTEALAQEARRIAADTRMPEALNDLFNQLDRDSVRFQNAFLLPRLLGKRALQETDSMGQKAAISKPQSDKEANLVQLNAATRPIPGLLSEVLDIKSHGQDFWIPTTTLGDVAGPRRGHSAVWTGAEMVVWGGYQFAGAGLYDGGARYDPLIDSWTPMTDVGAPYQREFHTAVWTGSEMLVWGGWQMDYAVAGGRYNPATDTWQPMTTTGQPDPMTTHTAVWSSRGMIVWGGRDIFSTSSNAGGIYDPATDTWALTPVNAQTPSPRIRHGSVWTGTEMLIWGGIIQSGATVSDGAAFNPISMTWRTMNSANGPQARAEFASAWTGNELLVWGGYDAGPGAALDSGGRYDPVDDLWTPMSAANTPAPRRRALGVWTGLDFIVWGGTDGAFDKLQSGGVYSGIQDSWAPTMISANTPAARYSHTLIWTGESMIVWGGEVEPAPFTQTNTGAFFYPDLDCLPAPFSPSVSDDTPCVQDGITITWQPGAGAIGGYDLLVDGVTWVVDVVSPLTYNPGNTLWHSYAIIAKTGTCESASSGAVNGKDRDTLPAPQAPTITDLDDCQQSGITITWNPVVGANEYDLYIDGGLVLPDVISPLNFNPGDTANHQYALMSHGSGCSSSVGAATTAPDNFIVPAVPTNPQATDPDICTFSGLDFGFDPVSGATSYNVSAVGPEQFTDESSPFHYDSERSFKRTPDMEFTRFGDSATTLLDGRVLIVGDFLVAELYDAATNSFIRTNGLMVDDRSSHTATLLEDGRVLIAGGLTSGGIIGTPVLFNPISGTFSFNPFDMVTPRDGHDAIRLDDGRILFLGGYDDASNILTQAEVYDPSTAQFLAVGPTTVPRLGPGVTLLHDGRVLVSGGFDPILSNDTDSTELFNPTLDTFNVGTPMIVPRRKPASILLPNGEVLIVGGRTISGYSKTAEIYTPQTNAWRLVGEINYGRWGLAGFVLGDGSVLVTGGSSNGPRFWNTHYFDLVSETFSDGPNLTVARSYHSVAQLDHETFLIVGGGSPYPSAEILRHQPSELQVQAVIGTCPGPWTAPLLIADQGETPAPPNAPSITDDAACSQSGITLSWYQEPTVDSYNLYRDGVLVQASVMSPQGYNPGDTASHTYALTTVRSGCESSLSAFTPFIDRMGALGGPQAPLVQDADICSYGTVVISWADLDGAESYDLEIDGGISVTDITSPYLHGTDQNAHNYAIRANAVGCTSTTGAVTPFIDLNYTPLVIPGGILLADPDICLESGVDLSWDVEAGVTGYEVLSGGQVIASSTEPQATVNLIYDFVPSGVMGNDRPGHTTNLLPTGEVVIIGGDQPSGTLDAIELYDPTTGLFTDVAATPKRQSHTATLLPDGRIIIIGGTTWNSNTPDSGILVLDTSTWQIYDSGLQLGGTRLSHTATLLGDGRILIAGGQSERDIYTKLNTSEVVDIYAGTVAPVSQTMAAFRSGHTATLLDDGRVLIVGSTQGCTLTSQPELFDPFTDTFVAAGLNGNQGLRLYHEAIKLDDGRVLLAGGVANPGCLGYESVDSIEIYDPTLDSFQLMSSTVSVDLGRVPMALTNRGTVLLLEDTPWVDSSVDLYDPQTDVMTALPDLTENRNKHTMTSLLGGEILITGSVEQSLLWTPGPNDLTVRSVTNTCTGAPSSPSPAADATRQIVRAAPAVVRDTSDCFVGQVEVSWAIYTGLANQYDLYVDDVLFDTDITSPYVYSPADSLSHKYQIKIHEPGCGGILSDPAWARDLSKVPPTPIDLAVVDFTNCEADGLIHTWSDVSLATSYDLYVDDILVVIGAVSGGLYDPGDNGTHTYKVQGVGEFCPGPLSTGITGQDIDNSPLPATVLITTDLSGCDPTGVELNWSDSPDADYHQLLEDGIPVGTVTSPYLHRPQFRYSDLGVFANGSPENHTTTLLSNGKFLVAGSTQPGAGRKAYEFTPFSGPVEINNMNQPRGHHTATLLPDGRVLIAGGEYFGAATNSAEIYDPGTAQITAITSPMMVARSKHTATMLPNGMVLIAGGTNGVTAHASAELFDPQSNGFYAVVDLMDESHAGHFAALMEDGKVLLAGGQGDSDSVIRKSAELFDPKTRTFSRTGSDMVNALIGRAAVKLSVGQVAFFGGRSGSLISDQVETYSHGTQVFSTASSSLLWGRHDHQAVVMEGGLVLIAGGQTETTATDMKMELFDPKTNFFQETISQINGTSLGLTLNLSPNGQILFVLGGFGSFRPEDITYSILAWKDGCPSHLDANATQKDDMSLDAVSPPVVSDAMACSTDQVVVAWINVTGATGYDLYRDGVLYGSDVTSPASLNEDGAEHEYSLLASASPSCEAKPLWGTWGKDRVDNLKMPPAPEVTDPDLCGLGLLEVNWTPVEGGISYDLYEHGTLELTEITNPTPYTPGSTAPIQVQIQARNGTCQSDLGPIGNGFDQDLTPGPAFNLSWNDLDLCSQSGVQVDWEVPPEATGYDMFIIGPGTISDPATPQILIHEREFSPGPDLLFSRAHAGFTQLNDGRIMISGGDLGYSPGARDEIEFFDPWTETFSLNPNELAFPRHAHSSTLLQDGRVLIFGGKTYSSQVVDEAEIFDPETGTLQTVVDLPNFPRYDHTATLLPDGRIIIAGGKGRGLPSNLDNLEIFDPETETFSVLGETLSVPRTRHTAERLPDGKVLFIGGVGNSQYHDTLDIFDYNTGIVSTSLSTMSSVRADHTSLLLPDGRILITGGVYGSASSSLDSIEFYKPLQDQFELSATTMSVPRAGHSALLLSSKSVLIAGSGGPGASASETADLFNVESEILSPAGPMTHPRYEFGLFKTVASEIFAMGGYWANSDTTDHYLDSPFDVEIYAKNQTCISSPVGILGVVDGDQTPSKMGLTPLVSDVEVCIQSGVQISWTGVPDATSYNVHIDGIQEMAGVSSPVFFDPQDLAPHSFYIEPVNGGCLGGASPVTIFSDRADALQAPVLQNVVNSDLCGGVTVTWSAVPDAEEYDLYLEGTLAQSIVSSPLVFDPGDELAHDYQVLARSNGCQSPLAAILNFADTNETPPASQNVLASNPPGCATDPVTVTWDPANKATTYDITLNNGEVFTSQTSPADIYPAVRFGEQTTLMQEKRRYHTATLLLDGRVLLAGGLGTSGLTSSAELFDPVTGLSSPVPGGMSELRFEPTATLLQDGRVLLSGGLNSGGPLGTAEIFDPVTGVFDPSPPVMVSPRSYHGAVLLEDSRVVLLGGHDGAAYLKSMETFDPVSNTFVALSATLESTRSELSAGRLLNGQVLITGGEYAQNQYLKTAEIFDPETNQVRGLASETALFHTNHKSILLLDGTMIISRGMEIFDPVTETFSSVGSAGSYYDDPCLQPDGRVLFYGDEFGGELFTPWTQAVTPAQGSLIYSRGNGTCTPLTNGISLIAGGSQASNTQPSVEFFGRGDIAFSVAGKNPTCQGPMSSANSILVPEPFPKTPEIFAADRDPCLPGDIRVMWTHHPAVDSYDLLIDGSTFIPGVSSPYFWTAPDQSAHTISVRPVRNGCLGTWSASVSATDNGAVRPAPPQVTVTDQNACATSGLDLSWSAVAGATSYNILMDGQEVWSSLIETSAMHFPGDNQEHQYQLVYNENTCSSLPSAATPGSDENFLPPTITSGTVTSENSCRMSKVYLNWSQVPFVTQYDLDVFGSGGSFTDVSSPMLFAGRGRMDATGDLQIGRYGHMTATLSDGLVLVAGGNDSGGQFLNSMEIYDPTTGLFTLQNPMSTRRAYGIAVLLGDGRVLVAGGYTDGYTTLNSAEIFDPDTGLWTSTANTMGNFRGDLRATLLQDGTVLLAGGYDSAYNGVPSAERFNPSTNLFSPVVNPMTARGEFQISSLADGRVLIAGGSPFFGGGSLNTAEVFDPTDDSFTPTTNVMSQPRTYGTSTLLEDGSILMAGGLTTPGSPSSSTDLYEPASNSFSPGPNMGAARAYHSAVRAGDGQVILAGGGEENVDIYRIQLNRFDYAIGPMPSKGSYLMGTELVDGRVLFTGGQEGVGGNQAWIYGPKSLSFRVRAQNATCGGSESPVFSGSDTLACATPDPIGNTLTAPTGGGSLDWVVAANADQYALLRGTQGDLPNLANGNFGNDHCEKITVSTPTWVGFTFEDPTILGAGDFYWYLVRGENDGGVSGVGMDSNGLTRTEDSTGTCP